jgi:hypothetical protein
MRAKRKNVRERTELLNEGAQMSNELESERAMVVIELWWRFRVIGRTAWGSSFNDGTTQTARDPL